jgi:hypothetical protein
MLRKRPSSKANLANREGHELRHVPLKLRKNDRFSGRGMLTDANLGG